MDIIIADDYEEMSDIAHRMVRKEMDHHTRSVLGLATGSTPEGLYERLVEDHQEGGVDFSKTITFNLDEYVDLPPTHEQSYHYFMHDRLFDHINVDPDNIHLPDGQAENLTQECERYEAAIQRAGGIDLQVLGIGRDGHIGFNEPTTSLQSRTHIATLTPETVEDNARFFESKDEVPRFAITMGIQTILNADHCLLMACGERKAEAVRRAVEGPLTANVTASALQMHRDAVVLLDEGAASALERKDYYQWIQDNKDRLEGRE